MIGVLLPIYLSWADSVYVGGLKRYQTMGKLVLAMEMDGVLIYVFSYPNDPYCGWVDLDMTSYPLVKSFPQIDKYSMWIPAYESEFVCDKVSEVFNSLKSLIHFIASYPYMGWGVGRRTKSILLS